MKFSKNIKYAAIALGLVSITSVASAVTITNMSVALDGTVSYAGPQRAAWLKNSTGGVALGDVTGTPQTGDLNSLFPVVGGWESEGSLAGSNGTNDLFTVTSSSWGNGPINGTWAIDSSFWLTNARAVISMHVGNGSGNPDWFLWEITANSLAGSFYYNRLSGGGGGLSNLFLWGGGTPPPPPPPPPPSVPDSGTSAILVGLGLVTLGLFRRQRR